MQSKKKLRVNGSVLASLASVYDTCHREKTEMNSKELKQTYEVKTINPRICLIGQDNICIELAIHADEGHNVSLPIYHAPGCSR